MSLIEPRIIVYPDRCTLGYVGLERGKPVSYTEEYPPNANVLIDVRRAEGKPKLYGGRLFPRRVGGSK